MSVTPAYRDYVLDQLRRVVNVNARAMFGGVGLYGEGVFFGLISDDTLYLKVDAATEGDYLAAGMKPFHPFGDEAKQMRYFSLPVDVLEEPELLRPWVDAAIEVGRRSQRGG
jgi:DNA transformation protein and related proteins